MAEKPSNKQLLAIDIGGSSIKTGRLEEQDGQLTLSGKQSFFYAKRHVDDVERLLREIIEESGEKNVGISTFGNVAHDGTVITSSKIEGYQNINWGEILSDTGCDIRIAHDGRASTMGVYREEVKTGSLTHFVIGSGIGGGTILNGTHWAGELGYAGHYGHQRVWHNGEVEYLEKVASSWGIERLVEENLGKKESFVSIVTQAELTEFKEPIEMAGRYLGIGIANILHILNPATVTLGDGICFRYVSAKS